MDVVKVVARIQQFSRESISEPEGQFSQSSNQVIDSESINSPAMFQAQSDVNGA
jgi:hypothetical protein